MLMRPGFLPECGSDGKFRLMFRLSFRPRQSQEDETRRQAVEVFKARLRVLAGLGDDDGLAVNEIVCADPGCLGIETVVLVMRPGSKTRALKISKAMAEIEDEDVAAALAESHRSLTA